ncbi:hypothetical protein GE061_010313 [Apolygus lucorum]|uniref:Uncharacterized protein n=1 Tax=Apolygus lucorum TaxID=248454 RepID=A0A8S9Y2V8_APOLU|nr:hypothetical protein GE061_010313 [Apolygus lucorum]
MLSQKRHLQLAKHEASWTVNIEKWWRKAAGYSRLNGSSSPPLTRRNSEIQTIKKMDNDRQSQLTVKPPSRKPSTARPVVIFERTREVVRPHKWNNSRAANINEEFIEVFYWTQSRYNYPGQLERYRKNLCYCCADCPACQNEANRTIVDRHRPLAQGKHVPRIPAGFFS